ncbi:MAG: hypothetical protein H6772_03115 [Pseudomonadales bacterium]|nr:hypothetical protein [Pseudomonadales bacterium]
MINNIEDAMQPWADYASLNQAHVQDYPNKNSDQEQSIEEDADTTQDWKKGGSEERQFTSENSVRLANERSFNSLLDSATQRQQILDLWSAVISPDETNSKKKTRYQILTGANDNKQEEFSKLVAKKLETFESQDKSSKPYIDQIRQMASAEEIDHQMELILPAIEDLVNIKKMRTENLQEIKQEALDRKKQLIRIEIERESRLKHYELTKLIKEATYVQEVNECLKEARKLKKSGHLSINHFIDIIKIAQSKINRFSDSNSFDLRNELEEALNLADDMETINYWVARAKELHANGLLHRIDLTIFLNKVTSYKNSV